MNVQTISGVVFDHWAFKLFSHVKELTCTTYFENDYNFRCLENLSCLENLTCLEKFKLIDFRSRFKSTAPETPTGEARNHITFPVTLKTLTLFDCGLEWSVMSIIHSLPNLQILNYTTSPLKAAAGTQKNRSFDN